MQQTSRHHSKVFLYTTMLYLRLILTACAVVSVAGISLPFRRIYHEFIDTQYAGEVTIGNQTFLLVFDTSSPNVIIASRNCTGGSCDCTSVQKYNGTANSIGPQLSVTYFDTAVATGIPIRESLTILNLTTRNQGIILANQLGNQVCRLNASGVVGLAPPPARTLPYLDTVVDNFALQGYIRNVFSVYHARYPDGEHFGDLVLGGWDANYLASAYVSTPLVENTSWKFRLQRVLIGNVNVAGFNTLGLVDTSKSLILGPRSQVQQINNIIGCQQQNVSGRELCVLNCNRTGLPDFVLVVSNTNLNISSEYYVQRTGNICYSGIVPNNADFYMIGDFFIDHYYTQFNWVERVMKFARAVEVL